MINHGFILAASLLFLIAGLVAYRSTALSLPIPTTITILVALLPLAALANNAYSHLHSSRPPRFLIAHATQALLTTVLATLLTQRLLPSPLIECLLDTRWSTMFRAHDAESIRHIQDALACCGLNSVRDRAYPFPEGGGTAARCVDVYHRSTACRGPWKAAMQSSAALDLAVVVAVGVMQIIGLWMNRDGAWSLRRRVNNSREARPLLTAVDEEEVVETHDSNQGYQALEDSRNGGPRVEPSTIGQERNAWSDH